MVESISSRASKKFRVYMVLIKALSYNFYQLTQGSQSRNHYGVIF